jgi:hypothetical protein
VICAIHKDVDVVLLSAMCKEYIMLYFVSFYVNLLFILTYAPLVVGFSMLPE